MWRNFQLVGHSFHKRTAALDSHDQDTSTSSAGTLATFAPFSTVTGATGLAVETTFFRHVLYPPMHCREFLPARRQSLYSPLQLEDSISRSSCYVSVQMTRRRAMV